MNQISDSYKKYNSMISSFKCDGKDVFELHIITNEFLGITHSSTATRLDRDSGKKFFRKNRSVSTFVKSPFPIHYTEHVLLDSITKSLLN